MPCTFPEPLKSFKPWLLRRAAQGVEAGEVSVDLLTELRAEFEAARDRPQEQSHADAVQDIASRFMLAGLPCPRQLILDAGTDLNDIVKRFTT